MSSAAYDFLGDDDEDFEPDLTPTKPRPKAGPRPGAAKPPRKTTDGVNADARTILILTRPLSITFLCQIFSLDRKTAIKRLTGIDPKGYHRSGHSPLYGFPEAARALVGTKAITADGLKRLTAADLPSALSKDMWDARLKEQKWRQLAGELWPTEDVMEVFGDAFKVLKTTTQLWADSMAEDLALDDAVRQDIVKRVDELQRLIHEALVKMPLEKSTKSQEAEIESDDE